MKKTLIITYPSSLYFWLNSDGRGADFRLARTSEIPPVSMSPVSQTDVEDIKSMLKLPGTVSLLGTKKVPLSAQNQNYYYIRKTFAPPNSFFVIKQQNLPYDLYIAGPEYSFLKASKDYSFEKLAELACNLSAIYYKNPNEEFGQAPRKKITSVEKISEFLDSARGSHGVRKAAHALSYALDNSNSPMESKLAVLCMLPFSLGGYSLRTPELNGEVKLYAEGAKILGRDACRGDIVWKEKRVILEYDSNLTHLSPNQHSYDKRRQTALATSGYQVINATAADVHTLAAMDALFKTVRKALGLRAENAKYNLYRKQRLHVMMELLGENR